MVKRFDNLFLVVLEPYGLEGQAVIKQVFNKDSAIWALPSEKVSYLLERARDSCVSFGACLVFLVASLRLAASPKFGFSVSCRYMVPCFTILTFAELTIFLKERISSRT